MRALRLLVGLMLGGTALAAQSFPSGAVYDVGRLAFGASLAVGEDQVFVGEPQNTYRPGTVYVYSRGGGAWEEAGRIVASDGENADGFGRHIASDGSRLVASSNPQDGSQSAVYFFDRTAEGGWREVARLVASDVTPEDGFGVAVAVSGDWALAGAYSQNELRGAAYMFRREGGTWVEHSKLLPDEVEQGDRFGVRLAMSDDQALIAATRHDEGRGAVFVYGLDPTTGTWSVRQKLQGAGVAANDRFGSSISLAPPFAAIGTGRPEQFTGSVWGYRFDGEAGEWSGGVRLMPFDAVAQTQFGTAVSIAGAGQILVGAPGSHGFEGRVYAISYGESGFTSAAKLGVEGLAGGSFFGSAIAARGGVAVAGAAGADFGAGTAAIFEHDGRGHWSLATRLTSPPESLDPITGNRVVCEGGEASIFECEGMDIVSFLPVSSIGGERGIQLNDVWGWTDPETGREYAIVGRQDGTAFVDLSDPANPVYVGNLPKTDQSPASVWRDMKVFANHAFIVAGGAGPHGMQIFDLTRLRDVTSPPVTFEADALYDRINSAHNVVVNTETGYAYVVGASAGGETCGGGLHMVDVNDPKNPRFAGCFADPNTGNAGTGYSHDAQCIVYGGPHEEYTGREICFGANETALSISDVSDKDRPIAISSAAYPNVAYAHQGWVSEDHRYFFMNDELDEISGNVEGTRTLVWDITDLEDPVLLTEFTGSTGATDHNLYIRGNLMYQSNYVAGLRVIDVSDPGNPREIGYFDTVPFGSNSPGFSGSWSNYPFFESGVVVVTSDREGLFILQRQQDLVP